MRIVQQRAALYVLTSLVALATGLALIGTALTIGAPLVADPGPVATEEVARAFYGAVAETIRTGDPAALGDVVASNLISHGPFAALGPGRTGLERYLDALHATSPDLEIAVESTVTARDRVVVYLAVGGADEEDVLGIPRHEMPAIWGMVDALRVAGGKVVEYWPGAQDLAWLEPLGRRAIDAPGADSMRVSLDRLIIPPDEQFVAEGSVESRLIFVEAGTVTVTTTVLQDVNSIIFVEPAETTTTLTTGDLFVVPTLRSTSLYNPGDGHVSLIVSTLWPLGAWYPPEWIADPAEAIDELLLAADPHIDHLILPVSSWLPVQQLVVVFGRMTLTPGATLPPFRTAGPLFVVVEQGDLSLALEGRGVGVRSEAGAPTAFLDATTLAAGDRALIHAKSIVSISGAGDESVSFLVVAILPDDGDGGA